MGRLAGIAFIVLIGLVLAGCMRNGSSGPPAGIHTVGIKIITGLADTDGDGTLDIHETYVISDSAGTGNQLLEPGKSVKDMDFKIRKELTNIPSAKLYCDGHPVPPSTTIHFEIKGSHNAEFEATPTVTRMRWKYKDDSTPLKELTPPDHGDVPIPRELGRLKRIYYLEGSDQKSCELLWIARNPSE